MSRMLNKGDACWSGTKEWLEARIGQLHLELERVDLDAGAHSRIRGMIAAYREIISTVEPEVVNETPSPNYHA